GGSDILGRAMGEGIEEVRDGVTVTVENRAGGSGVSGYSFLLQQQGDPHFLLPSETAGVALPITVETPFEWSDFTQVAMIAEDATLGVVRDDSEWQDVPAVIEAAEGGQVRVGITGATSLDSVVTSLIERDQDVEFDRVVFDSGGELVAALLGGDIDFAMLNPSEVIGQLEAGDMRALAVFAEERYPEGELSDLPTATEQGVDVSFTQYRGAFAAGGLTDDQAAYWEQTFLDWTETESYDEYVETNYLVPMVLDGDEFVDYLTEYQTTLEEVLADAEE
ncbi:MAG: tripartite tricarboxylate transporter substrate binding protein, partial [Egibacteraceae bacterium]